MPHFSFMDQLCQFLLTNNAYQQLLQQIQDAPVAHPEFSIQRGLIFNHRKLWLPFGHDFIPTLLAEFHATLLGGHRGITKTLRRIQDNFCWPNMWKDVHAFISEYLTCQQVKYKTRNPASLLQPLPIPTFIWEDLTLDCITRLPMSYDFSVILVVVDKFSKSAHFGALSPKYSAHRVALLFLDTICKLCGFPRSLVFDRGPIFLSQFWWELFHISGTKLWMSTSYHLETDDQTKVLNRTLKQYLCSFIHDKPSQWFNYLTLAEWSYNTIIHSATGISHFEATYDKPPRRYLSIYKA